MVKKLFVMRNKMASIKVSLVKYFPPQFINVQRTDAFVKLMQLRVFNLKTKFLISLKTLIRRLWGIAICNVLKSKAEMLLFFSLSIFYLIL